MRNAQIPEMRRNSYTCNTNKLLLFSSNSNNPHPLKGAGEELNIARMNPPPGLHPPAGIQEVKVTDEDPLYDGKNCPRSQDNEQTL